MDVGPARLLRSPLVFQVGAEPHFPRLEQFPTGFLITRGGEAWVKISGCNKGEWGLWLSSGLD